MVVPKFKLSEVTILIGVYLLVVLSINLYFLNIIYGILSEVVSNRTEVMLYGIKSIFLIVLMLVSLGVYLNTQTKQSTLFLTAVLFIGLSVTLNYLKLYYLNDWSLELLHRVLYALGLYIMFKYIMNTGIKVKKPKPLLLKESYRTDTVLS
ncbi:hypothetical protein [Mariniflexile gromovii]|uniref:Uncharacterized protein n=1 Tax=Mariniflexile gromovii TaxID=362523 RepID=A0ABS4BX56_9FLAO|nr:hypothetical protein [Mariniflexile gromovii]MBP0905181.1 hypothetical protein [Mariniflexile gromovii]